jgi:hypothetical protein
MTDETWTDAGADQFRTPSGPDTPTPPPYQPDDPPATEPIEPGEDDPAIDHVPVEGD